MNAQELHLGSGTETLLEVLDLPAMLEFAHRGLLMKCPPTCIVMVDACIESYRDRPGISNDDIEDVVTLYRRFSGARTGFGFDSEEWEQVKGCYYRKSAYRKRKLCEFAWWVWRNFQQHKGDV